MASPPSSSKYSFLSGTCNKTRPLETKKTSWEFGCPGSTSPRWPGSNVDVPKVIFGVFRYSRQCSDPSMKFRASFFFTTLTSISTTSIDGLSGGHPPRRPYEPNISISKGIIWMHGLGIRGWFPWDRWPARVLFGCRNCRYDTGGGASSPKIGIRL